MLLGRPGLRAFAEAMGVAIADVVPDVPTDGTPPVTQAEETGWSALAARGIPFEIAGMLSGVVLGIAAVAAISLAAGLFT
jgi:hypothetical protein